MISDRTREVEDLLIDMVKQYCVNTVKPDGTADTYSHDFMSAGEGAFEYLVTHGLAKYCDNGVDIYFPQNDPKCN
jgi:hypothetical protein